jgi:hypothetical protein
MSGHGIGKPAGNFWKVITFYSERIVSQLEFAYGMEEDNIQLSVCVSASTDSA